MLQLYLAVGFLTIVPLVYGFIRFRRLSMPLRIFVIGTSASFCLWLFSYFVSQFKLGSTNSLHYITPVLYSVIYGFFYKIALRTYGWSRYLPLLPLLVLSYIAIDLYMFGQRKMAIDLMSHINAVICILGFILLNNLLNKKADLKRIGLFWLNGVVVFTALLGIVSSLLLNRLFQYQNNEWFSLLYFGFWSVIGCFTITLITYSIFLDSRKLPSLAKMPAFNT